MVHPTDLCDLSHGEVLRRFDARLAAMVHYFYLGQPEAVDPAVLAGPAQNRCPHCHKEFDIAHKRAALLILGGQSFPSPETIVTQV